MKGEEGVVVTGVGMVTSLGDSAEKTWEKILGCKTGESKVSAFDTSSYKSSRAHLVCGGDSLSGQELSRIVARQAVVDSGLRIGARAWRVAVALGTLGGELRPLERKFAAGEVAWNRPIDASIAALCPPQSFAAHAASEIGALGPQATFLSACSSSNHAIAHGLELLESGEADAVVALGIHLFSQTEFTYFHNLRSLAPDHCRPFDSRRRGLMIGEGAGALVLERKQSARSRGARGYAEIAGIGFSCDGYHVTSPHPTGEGAMRAMRHALRRAGASAGDIDFVSAHGTGTFVNDPIECRALEEVFGKPCKVPVSSVKSMIGHTMGASGVIETAICCLAIRDSLIPPTANFELADPSCSVDCVPNAPRQARLRWVMKNSFGFGGNNVSLILKGCRG